MKTALLLALLAAGDKLPEGPGKAALVKDCGGCHGPEAVIGNANTRKGWEELIDEMIDRGAVVSEQERKDMVDYLARHFPMRRR